MDFHYPTLMFFSSLVSFLIVILYIFFILFTKTYKLNIILFTIGRGLIVLGVIGVALRGNIPDFISLTLSNIIILCGTGVTILGILSYNKKTISKQITFVIASIIVITSVLYIIFVDSYSHRSVTIYFSISIMTLMGGVILYLNRESFRFPIFISIVLFLYGFGRIVFAIQHLGLPDHFNPVDNVTTSQLFVPLFSILSLAISVGFLLLLREVDVRIIHENNIELKRLNVNKDKLIKIIAHDLRAPFNSILGFSELLVESTKEDPIENIRNFASKINLSAQKAFESTNTLLEWVLANTKDIKPNIKSHSIIHFVNEICLEFSIRIKEKKIVFNKEIPETLKGNFDENMLGSILRNLLSNAVKFSPENKVITITVEETINGLTFSIKDQGIGIENHQLKSIFSTDPKPSSPGTKGEHGSGLGLSICKELIEKHSGKIWVESIVNKGSTFSFSIPQNNQD